jgi:hypothetical protein
VPREGEALCEDAPLFRFLQFSSAQTALGSSFLASPRHSAVWDGAHRAARSASERLVPTMSTRRRRRDEKGTTRLHDQVAARLRGIGCGPLREWGEAAVDTAMPTSMTWACTRSRAAYGQMDPQNRASWVRERTSSLQR